MHKTTAVFWIRDGVLVDRMHVNAVSFAVACLSYAASKAASRTNLATLINFGFATSGISCADKMRQFNNERLQLLPDVTAAAKYYDVLATEAASHCSYFPGARELVEHLKAAGVLNFITSAVEQSLLDTWVESPQGMQLAPHLTEVLGKRPAFNKGRDHFAHVCRNYGVDRIFYVADAVAEISDGAQLSHQFNISPIGFAHVITPAKVGLALRLVIDAHEKLSTSKGQDCKALTLDAAELSLPDEETLTAVLQGAKATHVTRGDSDHIFSHLSGHLKACGLLAR